MDRYNELAEKRPWLPKLSAQLKATLMSLCHEEPLSIIVNTAKGPHSGLESLRRLNNRYDPVGLRAAKNLLAKILGLKSVSTSHLRAEIEQMERWCAEYHIRTGTTLAEDLRMLVLEQLVQERLKTHVSLNVDRLISYAALRAEVIKSAEKVEQEARTGGGPTPMELDAVVKGKGKRKDPSIQAGASPAGPPEPMLSLR